MLNDKYLGSPSPDMEIKADGVVDDATRDTHSIIEDLSLIHI